MAMPTVDIEHAVFVSREKGTAEEKLVCAVLERAFSDLTIAEYREKAIFWICHPNKEAWSFDWCCDVLGITLNKHLLVHKVFTLESKRTRKRAHRVHG